MTIQCCFKQCKQIPLTQQCKRVEIKSSLPKTGLTRWKQTFLVLWKPNGEATFHTNCWNHLLRIARKRSNVSIKSRKVSRKEAVEELNMVQAEKMMIREAKKTVERFDSAEDIKKMALEVANMISKSKRCVFFTGAGISTSAGLGDFRGKGGKWTEQDREAVNIDDVLKKDEECSPELVSRKRKNRENENGPKVKKSKQHKLDEECSGESSIIKETVEDKDDEEINYEDLRPTFTHESISKLVHLGKVKYVISQNCDGLHLLSGVPSDKISELHGNVFVEKCEKCHKRYERSFYVCDDIADMYLEELSDYGKSDIIVPKFMKECERCGLSHRTGRKCEQKNCKGYLLDTIINFGDGLEEAILDKAYEVSYSCDLMVCLGTTLTVFPACELVEYIKEPQRVVICNRQPTEKDDLCQEKDKNKKNLGVRIYGDCDTFMEFLMSKLLNKKQHEQFLKDLKAKPNYYNDGLR